jgi:hypothetical protein
MKLSFNILASLKARKLQQVNEAFEQASRPLTEEYPQTEVLTWPAQMAEALAWELDPNTPTPYLDGLADARQLDRLEFRQRTLAKVQQFKAASQALVGLRQRLEDQIEAATTAQELDAISWPSP